MKTSLLTEAESMAILCRVWGIERKVIVGHWSRPEGSGTAGILDAYSSGNHGSSHIRVCRVADNMRNVAVAEGDKVEAQIKFGWEVDAYPVNEVAEYVKDGQSRY